MNFTELFAKLPTSSFEDWESAARAQLKGKPLDSINISIAEGTPRAPYAMEAESVFKGGDSQGWIPFSSFPSGENISADLVLDALNGGAQGIELSFQDFVLLEGQLTEVRFDFISLKITGLLPSEQSKFSSLIPEGQRSAAKLVIVLESGANCTEYQDLVDYFGEVSFLLSPKLQVNEKESLYLVFNSIKTQLEKDGSLSFFSNDNVSIGVEVVLSPEYLSNITFVHAANLLFANVFNSFGFAQPLPRPFLYGRIAPDVVDGSHETYLIDATARAVAGISGGLDALVIEAYPDTDALIASRRARNIQNVLAIEGLLGIPNSAVRGANFFESVAKDLVTSIWPDS